MDGIFRILGVTLLFWCQSAGGRNIAVSPLAEHSGDSWHWIYSPDLAFDENSSTAWISSSGVGPRAGTIGSHYLQVVWDAAVRVDAVEVMPMLAGELTVQKFEIQYLTGADPLADASWTTLHTVANYGSGTVQDPYGNGGQPVLYTLGAPLDTKGIRLNIPWSTQFVENYYTGGGGFDNEAQKFAQISELAVHGLINWGEFHAVSTQGGNRATSYPGANKIVTTPGIAGPVTHVTWVDYSGTDALVQSDGSRVKSRSYDHTARTWSSVQDLGEAGDNHGGGTMALDAAGRLNIVYGAHGSPLKFRRMTDSSNGTWGAEETIVDYSNVNFWGGGTTTNYQATYPSMVADHSNAEKLHLVFRGGAASPSGIEYFRREWTSYGLFGSEEGYQWNKIHTLVRKVRSPAEPYYTEYGNALGVGPTGTLHLAYHFEQQTGTDTYTSDHVGYLRSTDGGNTWTNASGETLVLPALPDEGPALVRYQAGSEFAVSSLDVDSSDHPWFAVTNRNDGSFELYHHDGGEWQFTDLTPIFEILNADFQTVGDAQLAIGDNDDEIMILASYLLNGETWAQPSAELALLRSEDYGLTWHVKPISPLDPLVANWGGLLERGTGHNQVYEPYMMYTHGNWNSVNTEVRFVDGSDLSLVNGFVWTAGSEITVPEPSALALTALAALVFWRKFRGGRTSR